MAGQRLSRVRTTLGALAQGGARVRSTMREDIRAAKERDPAARSDLEIALLYPGLHAVWTHRISHELWKSGATFPARALSQAARAFTGIEIHPGAKIGRRFFIDHGMGVVIGETAEVGDDVLLYHGVTLGGRSLAHTKRHPTVHDRAVIGAGARILGPITVGEGAHVGANAVVVKPVPAEAVAVGVPAQVKSAPGEVSHDELDALDPAIFI